MMFILLFAPADVYSFEKMNGNHLVLLTSQEAYDLNKNEQNKLIKKRAMNVCRLLDKELMDYSVEKIKEEFIPEKPNVIEENTKFTKKTFNIINFRKTIC